MIKRIFIIVLILILTATTISANTQFGLRGGLNRSNMTGVEEDNKEANGRWRGTFGLYMMQSMGSLFVLHFMLLLTWKGFTKRIVHTTSAAPDALRSPLVSQTQEMTEAVSLGYVQIPVLLRYDIPVKGKFIPRIMAGPSFSINISAKDKASGFGDWDGTHDIGNLKKLDVGGIIGVGVSFPVGKLNFGVDMIYDRSFGSAFKDVSEEELANDVDYELWTKNDPVTFERTTKAVDFKNSCFSFQVSMILPIGKSK